jgi:hypothetical protein
MSNEGLSLSIKQKRLVQKIAFRFFWKFNDVLKKETGREYLKAPKIDEQYRLLTFRYWISKHKVSLEFIVQHVVKYWIKKYERPRKSRIKIGVGVRLATLTGMVSEQILLKNINAEFPNEENVLDWRQQQRNKQIPIEISNISRGENPEDFVKNYLARVERKQRTADWDVDKKKRFKRNYRDNPYL